MTEGVFFDDHPPTEGLSHWATITQVSTFLSVPRTTVRGTVRRAATSGESWVKKAMAEERKFYYLIDTTHEIYQMHQQRWKQNQDTRAGEVMVARADRSRTKKLPVPASASIAPLSPFSWLKSASDDEVLSRWPTFRQQLHCWGLQIFQNILAEEGEENLWQWRWGELHGEGYHSLELALLAAMEHRLMVNETPKETPSVSQATISPLPAPTDHAKPQGFTLFGRRQSPPGS